MVCRGDFTTGHNVTNIMLLLILLIIMKIFGFIENSYFIYKFDTNIFALISTLAIYALRTHQSSIYCCQTLR